MPTPTGWHEIIEISSTIDLKLVSIALGIEVKILF
ncbi:hypothetical protein SAMN05192588_1048 [Nonlabens sp. Hel1_33_55]|nr:hypothetical protein SAMN05192588_1048 [Nonlabens sp. Hel1_33_55]